jgi:hypothetical protein
LAAYCDPVYDDTQEFTVVTWQRVVVSYAGSIAQADLTGRHPITVFDKQTDDHDAVGEHVRSMHERLGPDELHAWRRSAWDRAIEIVTTRRDDLHQVADALTRERTLLQSRLQELVPINAAPIGPPSA